MKRMCTFVYMYVCFLFGESAGVTLILGFFLCALCAYQYYAPLPPPTGLGGARWEFVILKPHPTEQYLRTNPHSSRWGSGREVGDGGEYGAV